jgi:hypothetical protein
MSEIDRYISFLKNQSQTDLSEDENKEYLEFSENSKAIDEYLNRMKKISLPLEMENSILENNMKLDWLGLFIENIIKNDLKEILNNKKILEYIKNVNGRYF